MTARASASLGRQLKKQAEAGKETPAARRAGSASLIVLFSMSLTSLG